MYGIKVYIAHLHTCMPLSHKRISVRTTCTYLCIVYKFFNIILFAYWPLLLKFGYHWNVCAQQITLSLSHALGLSLSWLTVPSLSCDLRLSLSCRHCPSKNFIASAARVALKTNQRYKGHKYFYELKAVVLFGRKAA